MQSLQIDTGCVQSSNHDLLGLSRSDGRAELGVNTARGNCLVGVRINAGRDTQKNTRTHAAGTCQLAKGGKTRPKRKASDRVIVKRRK